MLMNGSWDIKLSFYSIYWKKPFFSFWRSFLFNLFSVNIKFFALYLHLVDFHSQLYMFIEKWACVTITFLIHVMAHFEFIFSYFFCKCDVILLVYWPYLSNILTFSQNHCNSCASKKKPIKRTLIPEKGAHV